MMEKNRQSPLSFGSEIGFTRVLALSSLSTIARARICSDPNISFIPFFPSPLLKDSKLTFRSLATSTSATLRLCVFLRRTRASACTGGALVAAAACAVDFVFRRGFFAGAVESGLFAAGAGGFFCADAAAGAAAAGYGDGGGGG
jgi:hypothetical protein